MHGIEGFVDHLFVAYVRIKFSGDDEFRRAQVDTGFNGELWIPKTQASTIFGIQRENNPREYYEEVTYADGSRGRILVIYPKIIWFGTEREVTAFVSEGGSIMVGSGLLIDCILKINFPQRKVRIVNTNRDPE